MLPSVKFLLQNFIVAFFKNSHKEFYTHVAKGCLSLWHPCLSPLIIFIVTSLHFAYVRTIQTVSTTPLITTHSRPPPLYFQLLQCSMSLARPKTLGGGLNGRLSLWLICRDGGGDVTQTYPQNHIQKQTEWSCGVAFLIGNKGAVAFSNISSKSSN